MHFEFATTGKLIFEQGAIARLADHAASLGMRRILLVTDKGIVAAGLVEPALTALRDASFEVMLFDTVVADPPVSVIDAACDAARAGKADGVIGLGGGSSLDAAKLVAVITCSGERLEHLYGIDQIKGPRLPLILIPTTAGTGSEVTPISIVTVGAEEKKGVVSPVLLPDIALLDPDLTMGLPPQVTAATGIDAMVHAIEAYTSAQKKNPVSDALATKALGLLGRSVPQAYENGVDKQARSQALLGSCLAGMAFANAPVAAVHALAYPIGARFHVPHGVSNALVLPAVLKFNLPEAGPLYAELAPLICTQEQLRAASSPQAAFVATLERYCDEMAVPRRLRDVGIVDNDIDQLADDAMEQTRLLVNNPRPVTRRDVVEIYRATL
ncbi:MAG: iron-containing alcohol dehydrogenase [Pseudomonadota bacterium]